MDVCDRVRRAGWDVLYAGALSIIHHQGRSFEQQDSVEIRAAVHGGPRRLFKKHHGPFSVFLYDAIMFSGYLIRWPAFWALSLLRPGRGYEGRSRFSRSYVRSMLRSAEGAAGSRPDHST